MYGKNPQPTNQHHFSGKAFQSCTQLLMPPQFSFAAHWQQLGCVRSSIVMFLEVLTTSRPKKPKKTHIKNLLKSKTESASFLSTSLCCCKQQFTMNITSLKNLELKIICTKAKIQPCSKKPALGFGIKTQVLTLLLIEEPRGFQSRVKFPQNSHFPATSIVFLLIATGFIT